MGNRVNFELESVLECLGRVAQGFPSSSEESTSIELAARALHFIYTRDELDEFRKHLETCAQPAADVIHVEQEFPTLDEAQRWLSALPQPRSGTLVSVAGRTHVVARQDSDTWRLVRTLSPQELDQHPATQRFVEVADGVSLWVESWGPEDAPAILLIMGANASGLAWPDELLALLSRRHRVIRYDHRDTGAATWAFDTKPYPITRLAEDAVAVLDALGISRAHVVGMSLGGLLVQLLLLDHPQRLLSATVFGIPALGGTPAPADGTAPVPIDEGLLEFWSHMFEPRDLEAELDWRVENWRRLHGRVLPFDAEEYRALERRIIRHAGRHDNPGAHARASTTGLERGAELAHVTVPTLVIATPEDPINPAPNARHLAANLSHSTLVTLEGMGHALPRVLVPSLAAALLRHIAAVERGAGGSPPPGGDG